MRPVGAREWFASDLRPSALPNSDSDAYFNSNGNIYAEPHGYGYIDSSADGNTNSDGNSYAYADIYTDCDSNSNSDSDGYTYCACYSNTYTYLRSCRLAIGSAPDSGTLCDPGCARYRQ